MISPCAVTAWDSCLFSQVKNILSVVLACAVLRVFNLFGRDEADRLDIVSTSNLTLWLVSHCLNVLCLM